MTLEIHFQIPFCSLAVREFERFELLAQKNGPNPASEAL